MSRPTAQSLNRAPGITSSRQQAAPRLAVQAPLNVTVGPNNLQGLAEILGVGANIAVSRAAKESERRVQEETELLNAKAEADVHGDSVDEEQYRTSRTYARRVDTLRGARQGVELSIAMRSAADDFVKENPLADENELRDFLQEWQERELVDEEGNPILALQNDRSEAVVRSSLSETGYAIIAGHREGYQSRVKEQGGREAVGLFVADATLQGGTSIGNLENLRTQLRSFGYTETEANAEIVQTVIALARKQRNPDMLDLIPEAWVDGTVGPSSNPEHLSLIDTQRTIIKDMRDAELREANWGARYDVSVKADALVRQGLPLPDDMVTQMRDLGYSPEAIASLQDQAARRQMAIQQALADEREKAMADDLEFEEWQANPFSFTKSKSEDILGVQFDRAIESGNTEAAWTIVRQGIEANVLPRSLRNRLDRVPASTEDFQQWHQMMERLDQEDDQVFGSLGEDARMAYHAYNGLMSLGQFSPQQAFMRLQQRDAARGREFVRSQNGIKAIDNITDGEGTMVRGVVERYVQGFAALGDVSDAQVVQFAQEAFEKDYYVEDGFAYRRSHVSGPNALSWMKKRYALDSTRSGTPMDHEDVIVAPIEGSSDILFRDRRDPTRVRVIPVADLNRMMRQDAAEYRNRRDAPARNANEAVEMGLNPWRRIEGESGLDRQLRAGRENAIRERQGLPVYATPTTWSNQRGDARVDRDRIYNRGTINWGRPSQEQE